MIEGGCVQGHTKICSHFIKVTYCRNSCPLHGPWENAPSYRLSAHNYDAQNPKQVHQPCSDYRSKKCYFELAIRIQKVAS